MTVPHDVNGEAEAVALRQLALVDRILGLEAEVANLRSVNVGAEVQAQLNQVRSSATWRVGSAVLAPVRLVKRVVSRGGRR